VQAEEDSRGIDIIVRLNKPEAIATGISYAEELYKLDGHITDVIGFKTYRPARDFQKFVALQDPYSPEFNARTGLFPLGYGELRADQIRGAAPNASDANWRYDFYLSGFPDAVALSVDPDTSDEEFLAMSKTAWDLFFDPLYRMPAYNVSLPAILTGAGDLSDFDFDSFGDLGTSNLEGVDVLRDANGSIIRNPIVFTDSFLFPVGLQLWIPMNTSAYGVPTYQRFTIGGRLDSQRAGGFPLTSFQFGGGDFELSEALGRLYLPEHWANQTNFLGEADGATSTSRAPNQFDYFLIKTTYSMDDDLIEGVALAIEAFTNAQDQGYRQLVGDDFFVADATVLYSKIEASLEMSQRIVSFLQIYVTFGLVIGSVGMGVISVRNVAERKREIGMMRAIGFPRTQVMLSVLLELVVLGVIGLVIGVANGLLISVGFANMQNVTLVIPWKDIGLYLGFIILIALSVGAIPGWMASRIPPAEALRYVG
jgi:hypothetical protein